MWATYCNIFATIPNFINIIYLVSEQHCQIWTTKEYWKWGFSLNACKFTDLNNYLKALSQRRLEWFHQKTQNGNAKEELMDDLNRRNDWMSLSLHHPEQFRVEHLKVSRVKQLFSISIRKFLRENGFYFIPKLMKAGEKCVGVLIRMVKWIHSPYLSRTTLLCVCCHLRLQLFDVPLFQSHVFRGISMT